MDGTRLAGTPRALTQDEARGIFMERVRSIAQYSAGVKNDPLDAANLTAFSILSLLDGSTIGFPAVDLHVQPHPEDKAWLKENGENWFEPGMVLNDNTHMHEEFHNG
jgi:hypothetical protein